MDRAQWFLPKPSLLPEVRALLPGHVRQSTQAQVILLLSSMSSKAPAMARRARRHDLVGQCRDGPAASACARQHAVPRRHCDFSVV